MKNLNILLVQYQGNKKKIIEKTLKSTEFLGKNESCKTIEKKSKFFYQLSFKKNLNIYMLTQLFELYPSIDEKKNFYIAGFLCCRYLKK